MKARRMTTKQLILLVAGELFMDKGYQATSTREIAEKAGITQPNLYHHFRTKEDIYIAVLENLSGEVREALEQIVASDAYSLEHTLQKVLDYLRAKHPVNFFIMSHDIAHEISSDNHQRLYKIWMASYLSPLAHLFKKYVSEKTPFTPNELGRHFYSTIAPFIQKDGGFYKEVSSEQVIHLFVYGILDRE